MLVRGGTPHPAGRFWWQGHDHAASRKGNTTLDPSSRAWLATAVAGTISYRAIKAPYFRYQHRRSAQQHPPVHPTASQTLGGLYHSTLIMVGGWVRKGSASYFGHCRAPPPVRPSKLCFDRGCDHTCWKRIPMTEKNPAK